MTTPPTALKTILFYRYNKIKALSWVYNTYILFNIYKKMLWNYKKMGNETLPRRTEIIFNLYKYLKVNIVVNVL